MRRGTPANDDACVALWCSSLESRDARRSAPGTADRARTTLTAEPSELVAAECEGRREGVALLLLPGSGFPADPPGASCLALPPR